MIRPLCASLVALMLMLSAAVAQQNLQSPRAAGTEPWLGINLSELRDYQPQMPFIDIMKTAREWTGHLPGQWGGWDEDDLRAADALDADGWLRRVPPELERVSAILMADLEEDTGAVAGNYRLTHDGQGRIELRGRVGGTRRQGRNTLWFSYSPGPGIVEISISQTDPDDPIRNIEIVHERNIAAHEAGEIFNPDWLARMDGMALFRFMTWANINYTTLAQWQDRPHVSNYTWTRDGVPLEIMIRLANETGAEPWISLPHRADDEFFAEAAALIREQLDPDLRAWIELSNETWNWSFNQAQDAIRFAEDRWGDRNQWQQWYAMRAAQMVQIFDQVFDGQEDRLVRVLATHTGWLGLEEQLLAPLWQAESPDNPSPPELFDAYAITGYFSALLGYDEKIDFTRGWVEDARATARADGQARGLGGQALEDHIRQMSHDILRPRLIEEMRDGRHSGDKRDTIQTYLNETLPYHLGVAQDWGLDLVAYEGGTHLVGVGAHMRDEVLADLFIDVNYSDGMGALYTDLLQGWFAAGGGQFVHYSDVRRPSIWGSFGALRHLTDHNPRWDALVGFDPASVQ